MINEKSLKKLENVVKFFEFRANLLIHEAVKNFNENMGLHHDIMVFFKIKIFYFFKNIFYKIITHKQ